MRSTPTYTCQFLSREPVVSIEELQPGYNKVQQATGCSQGSSISQLMTPTVTQISSVSINHIQHLYIPTSATVVSPSPLRTPSSVSLLPATPTPPPSPTQQLQEHTPNSLVATMNTPQRKSRRSRLDPDVEAEVKKKEQEIITQELEKTLPPVESIKPLHEEFVNMPGFKLSDTTHINPEENPTQYLMMILLQYQACKSFVNYTQDEEDLQEQVQIQRKYRLDYMKKKREIRRQQRKICGAKRKLQELAAPNAADQSPQKRTNYNNDVSFELDPTEMLDWSEDESLSSSLSSLPDNILDQDLSLDYYLPEDSEEDQDEEDDDDESSFCLQ